MPLPEKPDLPQAEFEIMSVLWRRGESSIREIHNALSGKTKRSYNTTATLLNRLKEKGYVEAEERNFAYVFRPLIKREQVVKRKLDDLINFVLGGDLTPLAAYLAENRKLTPEQIAALEEMLKSDEEGK